MEVTIKAGRQNANRRLKTTFDEMRQAAETSMPPAYEVPPVTDGAFPEMTHPNMGMMITQFDGLPGPSQPLSARSDFSHQSLPATPHMTEFSSAFDMKPDLF
jgi:hypothetical protein